ncbi:molybdopterin synthase sulfur carrier subunit [Psychrobacter sp. PL15]|uniref:MoaD/ThiS family protein n=1 Tax=Psychrobacter sp. PL15 TaxID=3071719 RepID=UPI002DFBDA4D|nr:molybdopterin synthase sulfur carrier subunit [Psychrobacter sp. PL15]
MSIVEKNMDQVTDTAITDSTMDINVLYFAGLADEANCNEEKITVAQSTSLTELYEQLRGKHRFSRPHSQLRVAVNDYFVKWTDAIYDGDNVVFITPVAGG